MTSSHRQLTRRAVWMQAWPIILSQAAVPLAGLVDTAVIGRTGDARALAAVAVGVTAMNLILWSFGFLRMGTTGLTSQAFGADDTQDIQATIVRAVGLGLGLGLLLLTSQSIWLTLVLDFIGADAALRDQASAYASARFWGAPFELAVYAFNGWLLGQHRSGAALALQIVMSVANIAFSLWLVLGLDLGPAGVGGGTALAQLTACMLGAALCFQIIRDQGGWCMDALSAASLFNTEKLKRLFAVNANIMIRTFALLILFTWFTRAGARLGETQLAANHVLMQILMVVAFVLDAFAYTAEARVGAAVGRSSRQDFWRAVRLTGEFCLAAGLALGAIVLGFGPLFIAGLAQSEPVREIAEAFLPYSAAMCVLGVAPWMLDGIFIGATRTGAMRNAAIFVTLSYIVLDIALRPFGAHGMWLAMSASYVLRAASLAVAMPALLRGLDRS